VQTGKARPGSLALANRVANASGSDRAIVAVSQAFEALVRSPVRARDITLAGFGRAAAVIGGLTSERLVLRRLGERVACGGFEFPEIESLPQAIRASLVELRDCNGGERIAGIGLISAIYHPLADGNGRLTRLNWLRGLLQWGAAVEDACEFVALLSGDRVGLADSLDRYQHGQPSAFVEHWNGVAKSARNAAALRIS